MALNALINELEEFSNEFDVSDPEAVQLLLDEHITNLMTQGHVSRRMAAPDLEDVLTYILRGHLTEDLLSSAEAMRRLIESYDDVPSIDDMEEAESLLAGILDELRGLAEKVGSQ
jgi:hypothetical protein